MSQPITIFATAVNATAALEYSLDGATGWQTSSFFPAAAPGTYRNIAARVQGTQVAYVYPKVVVVEGGAATPAPAPAPTPTFTRSYTTTAADYTTKCGAGTSGASVTRSATSTSEADALTQAKAAALNAITCPVPEPTYNTVLSPGETADVVTYNGLAGTRFKFNLPLPTGEPAPASMGLFFNGTAQGNVDFNGNIAGTACALEINGTNHPTTFQNTDTVNLT